MSVCVECRWCRLQDNSQERLSYLCEKRWEALTWDVARKKPCADFAPQPPVAHWGP